jgi:hypothetical protein
MIFTKYRTSHLMVSTHIINPSGNTKFLYNATDFIMHTNGNNPSLTDFPGSEFGVNVTLAAGAYAVTETKPEGTQYSAEYSPDCVGMINSDEIKKCEITNIAK